MQLGRSVAPHPRRLTKTTRLDSCIQSTSTFHHGVTYTHYEGNSFALHFNNTRTNVLVDPWLVEDLTFGDLVWLYRGKKRSLRNRIDVEKVFSEADLVCLTQYLDDHAHMPTLMKMPRHIPILANAEAAEKIKPLGFKDVQVIDHNESRSVAGGRLTITAFAGSLVGPPWSKRQNGYLFQEAHSSDGASASLLYEPHCDFDDASLRKLPTRPDIILSPVTSTLLGVGDAAYPLVLGDINLKRLLTLLKPKVLLPLLNAEIDSEGPLSLLMIERGTNKREDLRRQVEAMGLDVRVEMPSVPGESFAIAL